MKDQTLIIGFLTLQIAAYANSDNKTVQARGIQESSVRATKKRPSYVETFQKKVSELKHFPGKISSDGRVEIPPEVMAQIDRDSKAIGFGTVTQIGNVAGIASAKAAGTLDRFARYALNPLQQGEQVRTFRTMEQVNRFVLQNYQLLKNGYYNLVGITKKNRRVVYGTIANGEWKLPIWKHEKSVKRFEQIFMPQVDSALGNQ